MFKKIRITILLYVLLLVAGGSWLTSARSTDWDAPLWVVVFPIAGDNSAAARTFVSELKAEDFTAIETFMSREAKRYGLALDRPVVVKLARPLDELAPPPPDADSRNMLTVMLWSLQLRYWAWQQARNEPDLPADIRMFVQFHDPQKHTDGHNSLGLREGLIGVVNAFASRRQIQRNNIVIAHEMLHTVGATDKYDPATNLPLFPIGYAEPNRSPTLPQRFAELMSGRRPISEHAAKMPRNLKGTRIGSTTALEIRWR